MIVVNYLMKNEIFEFLFPIRQFKLFCLFLILFFSCRVTIYIDGLKTTGRLKKKIEDPIDLTCIRREGNFFLWLHRNRVGEYIYVYQNFSKKKKKTTNDKKKLGFNYTSVIRFAVR